MTVVRPLTHPVAIALLVAAGLVVCLRISPAQAPNNFNERDVKSSAQDNDPKSDVWTLDFRFKDPRLIKSFVPARGTRICWYMWYQVINRTKEPVTFYPEFELVTLDYPAVYYDEPLTTVEEEIRKQEDPSDYQRIKNSVTITEKPIPVSLPPEKGFYTAVTGVAIWDGTSADPKARDDKIRDLSDSQRFTIFVGGLSNGWVQVDPLAQGKVEAPIIRRKTLQLNFKRVGDRFIFEPPAEWIYRASRLRLPKRLDDDKDKQGAIPMPFQNLDTLVQPVLHRGNEYGS